jgi:Leucine-rich repeat (LRR) protein
MVRRDYKRSFWYYRPNDNFPPKAISDPEEYANTEFLNFWTKEPKDQKRWIQALPSLTDVKVLWVGSNVNQQMFESICNMPNLIGLNIQARSVKDIESLSKLSKLEYLSLFGITKVDSIEVLGRLKNLKVLNIENVKKIANFDALSDLVNLEELSIDGSMWTAQKIDNFEFVSRLTNLKRLSFVNTRANKKDFTPLLKLRELISFDSSYNYPQEEFEKLEELSKLKYSNVSYVLKEEDRMNMLYDAFNGYLGEDI